MTGQGAVTTGAPAAEYAGGSEHYRKMREPFAAELKDPGARRLLRGIISAENPGAGSAVAESLMNRTAMVNERRAAQGLPPLKLTDMIKGHPSIGGGLSFYGPMRTGAVNAHTAKVDRDPGYSARMDKAIDQALGGANTIKGHTDQGSAGDPNYVKGGIGVNINGERFNDWGYGGSAAWRAKNEAAAGGAGSAVQQAAVPPDPARAAIEANLPPEVKMAMTKPPGETLFDTTVGNLYGDTPNLGADKPATATAEVTLDAPRSTSVAEAKIEPPEVTTDRSGSVATAAADASPAAADAGGGFGKGMMEGIEDAFSGVAKAFANNAKPMPSTPANAALPIMPPAPGAMPMVDPKVIEAQRNMLAQALKRLNSGRLV